MKKSGVIAIATAALLTVTAVPLAFAARAERGTEGRGFGEHGAVFGILHHAADELELSEAQRQQLKSIAREVRQQNSAYRQSMRGGVKEVATILIANPNDITGAEAVLDAQDDARRQLRSNVLQGVSRAMNVLTPAQRSELGEMLSRFAQRSARF